MNYALIEHGVVANLIWLHPMNAEDFPAAVPLGELPVAMGDTYDGTDFYREGVKVELPSDTAEMDDMRSALALLGVTEETEVTE